MEHKLTEINELEQHGFCDKCGKIVQLVKRPREGYWRCRNSVNQHKNAWRTKNREGTYEGTLVSSKAAIRVRLEIL